MCDQVVWIEPRSLAFVPDCFMAGDICSEAVGRDAYTLAHVSNHLETQEMCNEAMREDAAAFFLLPDRFKK